MIGIKASSYRTIGYCNITFARILHQKIAANITFFTTKKSKVKTALMNLITDLEKSAKKIIKKKKFMLFLVSVILEAMKSTYHIM